MRDEDRLTTSLREIWFSGFRSGWQARSEVNGFRLARQRAQRRWVLGVAVLMLVPALPVGIWLTVLLLRGH